MSCSASELCDVYYAPLNFRDIMLATGKLSVDALPGDLASKVRAAFSRAACYRRLWVGNRYEMD